MHAGKAVQHRLDFGRIDVDTTGDHHVALAVADEDIALLVDITNVARGDEAITLDLGPLLRLIVISEVGRRLDPRIDLPIWPGGRMLPLSSRKRNSASGDSRPTVPGFFSASSEVAKVTAPDSVLP